MITQIKKIGGSLVIIIPTIFKDYMTLNEGDYIDISDIVKKNKKDVFKSIVKQTMKEIKNIDEGMTITKDDLNKPRDLRYIRKTFDKHKEVKK